MNRNDSDEKEVCSRYMTDDVLQLISRVFQADKQCITDIKLLKQGMTNHSFSFQCKGNKYMIRIPGEGTEKLICRDQEYEVYEALRQFHLTDEIVYISRKSGYKITKYWTSVTTCCAKDWNDVKRCMEALYQFHKLNLKVKHEFNLFEKIEFYESLRDNMPSIYHDYMEVKRDIFALRPFIDALDKQWGLAHIDAVPDNFVLFDDKVRILDWEYAAMQDQHVDLAMFAIYAYYDKEEIDKLINLYFDNHVPFLLQLKIYAYIAVCGLLWSNWCEYKLFCGVDFGDYSAKQFNYARLYSKIIKSGIKEMQQYKVDNAIIMAAGMSQRLAPLTKDLPKALLRVKGEILIERQIKQLLESGITKIIIVVGYKKELFEYLVDQYAVILVENPDFMEKNNHASLYYARKYLKNSYICSADNYFSENIFKEYVENAYYSTVYIYNNTNEWSTDVNSKGIITSVSIGCDYGKSDAWCMCGPAFFSSDFSKKFIPLLEETYREKEKNSWYWEDIYRQHLDQLFMMRKEYKRGIIFEFDTLEELRAFDIKYRTNSGCEILQTISELLECKEEEIKGVKAIIQENIVVGISFSLHNRYYEYFYEKRKIDEKE